MKKIRIEKVFHNIIWGVGISISILLHQNIKEEVMALITTTMMYSMLITYLGVYKNIKLTTTGIFLNTLILNILIRFSSLKLIEISIFTNTIVLVFAFICAAKEKYRRKKNKRNRRS